MKKFLALFLALIMVVGLLPTHAHAASCEGDNHDWGTNGICKNVECQAKCGHNWQVWKRPNCLTGGYTSAKCSICNMVNGVYETNAPKNHTFSGGVCSVCGAAEVNQETCEHNWNKTDTCTKCGATHTHNSDKKVTQTCGSTGYYNTKSCSVCNRQMEMVPTPASHTFVGNTCSTCGATKVDPETCVHNWNKTDTCTKCGTTHTHDKNDTHIQPCGTNGAWNAKNCSVCGKNMEMTQTPASHTFVGNTCSTCGATKEDPADCTHDWNKTDTCTKCGTTHTHDKNDTHIQTCGTSGAWNTKDCSVCGKNMEMTQTPATHTFTDGVCTVCGFEEPEEECTTHDWENGVCTVCGESCSHKDKTNYQNCVTGEYNTTVCEECGEIREINPVPGEHEMKDGKCTVCGFVSCPDGKHTWSQGVCSKCGAACPHDNTDTKHANCTGAGYVTTTCQDCGQIVELKPVPGYHTFRNGICIACGAKDPEYDDVPKTGDDSMMIMASMTGVALLAAAAYVFDQKRKSC